MSAAAVLAACGEPEVQETPIDPGPAPRADVEMPVDVVVQGCVQASGKPDLFLLSVSEREADRTRGGEPGSVVPRPADSPLPPQTAGKSTPAARPMSPARDRGETTAWTLTTAVYELGGSGGLDLQAHVGHKVEVTGAITEPAGEVPGKLRVDAARHVSDECVPYLRE